MKPEDVERIAGMTARRPYKDMDEEDAEAIRALCAERDAYRAALEVAEEALEGFRSYDEQPGFFHDCACGDCAKCTKAEEALSRIRETKGGRDG